MDRVLHALSDATRRRILDILARQETTAGDLARHFPNLSRPAVSQHIAVLREAGLVTERAEGRHRFYQLRPEPLREFWVGWLAKYQRFWDERLSNLKRLVESQDWEGEKDDGV